MKRILAFLGVVLILSMYGATLFFAVTREFDTCSSTLKPIFLLNKPFMASFFVKFYVFMCTSL